jgi:hypothetical protein
MAKDKARIASPAERRATLAILLLCLFCGAWAAVQTTTSYDPIGDRPGQMRDADLYRRIAASVADGHSYYAAAIALQRENGFPVQPFMTVRLPGLTLIVATFGRWLMVLAWTVFVAVLLLWHRRLAHESAAVRTDPTRCNR